MSRVKGILFDLGDTLIDFGEVDTLELFEQGARLTYDYLKQLGQPLPSFARYHRRQLRAIRWAYLKSRLTRREFNSMDLLGRLSERMGQNLSSAQFEQLGWLWYEPLSRQSTVESDLPDVLASFTAAGLKLAIISNTFIPGDVLDRHLRQLDLLRFFPVRIYSCDVRYRKPHPRIFRMALRELSLKPGEGVFVGDSLPADMKGAARAGMITVLKDPAGRKHQRHVRPDHVISRLNELPAIVSLYNSHD